MTLVFEIDPHDVGLLDPDRDLAGWEQDAVQLVMEYQLHGWSGRMSSNGHAIMHSPDGTETASLARKHTRNRGGLNARRPLQRWLKRQEEERQQEVQRSSAFGLPPHEHMHAGHEPPWRIAEHQSYEARKRMKSILDSWWKQTANLTTGGWQLVERGEDDWVVAWTPDGQQIVLAGFGEGVDPQDVQYMQDKAAEHNRKIKGNEVVQGPQQAQRAPKEDATQASEGFACTVPGCDAEPFKTKGALSLHATMHDDREYQCPLCDRVFKRTASLSLHLRGSAHANDARRTKALLAISSNERRKARMAKRAKKPGGIKIRQCEYCGVELSHLSIGGHHRGHTALGHIKLADGGDGATLPHAKAITADASTVAVTPDPDQATASTVVSEAVVNGTGAPETAEAILDQVRVLVNPHMVGELERLRRRNAELEEGLQKTTRERDDLQARLDMLKEALTV